MKHMEMLKQTHYHLCYLTMFMNPSRSNPTPVWICCINANLISTFFPCNRGGCRFTRQINKRS